MVWLIYSTAESLSVSFIGLGMGALGSSVNVQVNTDYLVLYLLIGNLVWRFLSQIFYWITDLINIERWEGTIEYTLMAPIRRLTHMAGQTIFSVVYSLIFTSVILIATALVFKIDLSSANLYGGLVMLLAGSFSFIGIGIMASVFPLLFPERGAQMTHVFIALLLLVSGVYYPVEVLPDPLKQLAVFSPATYVLTGTRHAILEGMPTYQLWPYVWPVLLMGAALIPAGLWVFGQGERYAKRTGKLHRNG
jgi:ABC-2 type transport system permease protein